MQFYSNILYVLYRGFFITSHPIFLSIYLSHPSIHPSNHHIPSNPSIYLLCLNLHGGHRQAVLSWRKAWVVLSNSVGKYYVKPPRPGRWQPTIHTYQQIFYASSPAGLEPAWQRYVASRWDNLSTNWAIWALHLLAYLTVLLTFQSNMLRVWAKS